MKDNELVKWGLLMFYALLVAALLLFVSMQLSGCGMFTSAATSMLDRYFEKAAEVAEKNGSELPAFPEACSEVYTRGLDFDEMELKCKWIIPRAR